MRDYKLVRSEIKEIDVTEQTGKFRTDMEKLYFKTMAECERMVCKSVP